MITNTWLTVEDLLRRWSINHLTLLDILFSDNNLPCYFKGTREVVHNTKALLKVKAFALGLAEADGQIFVFMGHGRELMHKAKQWFDKDAMGKLIDSLDIVCFRAEDVLSFEKQKTQRSDETSQQGEQLRPDQRHKQQCRKVAQELWQKDPTITIADMIMKNEINELLEGKSYTDRTIRNWINDLCPNRSPGRRKAE